MDQIKIKKASEKEIVGFGGNGKTPLGELAQEQLQKLALIAQQSKNKNLLRHFEGTLPSVKDLQALQTSAAATSAKQNTEVADDARQAVNKDIKPAGGNNETDRQKADKA